jgi:hypothetical protein
MHLFGKNIASQHFFLAFLRTQPYLCCNAIFICRLPTQRDVFRSTTQGLKKMTSIALKDTLDTALAMLQNVDHTDADAMFDCLVELELLARDGVADHSVAELLRANPMSMQEELPLSNAA